MGVLPGGLAGLAVVLLAASGAVPGYRCPITPTWGVLSSRYWDARAGRNGWRPHYGIDIASPRGMPVLAAMDGVVAYAGRRGGYGLVVYVVHLRSWSSLYAHLERVAVRPGQAVRCGEVIGFVGSTGRSTAPHLHFELRYRGIPVDPIPYLWAAYAYMRRAKIR